MSSDLYNQKWQKFLRRIWPFRFIPFVDFVLVAGSLATGNMNENSDFDVIIGVRQGRIFTVRAFCILAFGMFGWRAVHKGNNPKKWQDKICLNHFITPNAYRLSPPHNDYWKKLYESLVPVYGDPATIQKFYDVNTDWADPINISKYLKDPRYKYQNKGLVARIRECILKGKFGDWLEAKLKSAQIKKIEKSLNSQAVYKPRIIYNDNELEFHPDTKRVELFLEDNR